MPFPMLAGKIGSQPRVGDQLIFGSLIDAWNQKGPRLYFWRMANFLAAERMLLAAGGPWCYRWQLSRCLP